MPGMPLTVVLDGNHHGAAVSRKLCQIALYKAQRILRPANLAVAQDAGGRSLAIRVTRTAASVTWEQIQVHKVYAAGVGDGPRPRVVQARGADAIDSKSGVRLPRGIAVDDLAGNSSGAVVGSRHRAVLTVVVACTDGQGGGSRRAGEQDSRTAVKLACCVCERVNRYSSGYSGGGWILISALVCAVLQHAVSAIQTVQRCEVGPLPAAVHGGAFP